MGYEGGDLLLTGVARPTVGSLPRSVCAGCGRWPEWSGGSRQWRDSALEVAGSHKMCYTNRRLTFTSKGKVDHARMGVGGVLISLTLAVSPKVDKPLKSVMHGQW